MGIIWGSHGNKSCMTWRLLGELERFNRRFAQLFSLPRRQIPELGRWSGEALSLNGQERLGTQLFAKIGTLW